MKQLFKDKKYWKEMALLLLFGLLVNIACFCMPMVGHCATVTPLDTVEAPFVVMNNTNLTYFLNGTFNYEQLVEQVKTQYSLSNSDFIITTSGASVRSYSGHWCALLNIYDNVTYYGNVLQVNDVTDSRLSFQYSGKAENVYYDLVTNQIVGKWNISPDVSWSTSSGTISLLGPVSTSTYQDGLYYFTTYYPIYVNNTIYMYDGTTPIISQVTYIVPGDFTELPSIEEILNNISENYTPHSNDTPPTYDSSLSDGQNISNAITGHSNNMNNAINNLGENIENFFNKLYEKLTNVGNAVSTNIYNGFATLMQNIKDFFGAKLDAIIDRISQKQEESQQEIVDAFTGSNMYTDFDRISQVSQQAFSVWSDTAEPNSFRIPLHLEELPILHVEQCQYIDVGLFSPCFPYIRGIMWCFLVYSVLYTVIDSIANYINGGDE